MHFFKKKLKMKGITKRRKTGFKKKKRLDRDVCTSFAVGDDLDAVIFPCRHGASPQRSRAVGPWLQVLVQRGSHQ
jgi:hypothetical protein